MGYQLIVGLLGLVAGGALVAYLGHLRDRKFQREQERRNAARARSLAKFQVLARDADVRPGRFWTDPTR